MIQAHSLYEGSFSVDASKVFVPFDPKKDDPKDRPASLFVHVRPFLVETKAGLIVIDTGLGERTADGELLIHHNIKSLGFDPSDVRYVLMSHLHKDHMGGTVDMQDGSTRIAFPNAEYVMQEKEWENAYSTDSASYRTELFQALQRSGNLLLVDGDGDLNDEISYEVTGGHTEFHQIFHIRTGDEHYFFGGDVLSEPGEIFRNFVAKYDFDGRTSKEYRTKVWEKGAPEGWIFLFYHSKTTQIGKPVKQDDGSYKLEDLAE